MFKIFNALIWLSLGDGDNNIILESEEHSLKISLPINWTSSGIVMEDNAVQFSNAVLINVSNFLGKITSVRDEQLLKVNCNFTWKD